MAAHVFLSYVRQNALLVERLKKELEASNIVTWLDRVDLAPGARWKLGIRCAIREAAFFIACFSAEYRQRTDSWMNEELTLAIERLRQRHVDSTWFIPVKLARCELPELDIGGGQLLSDLQYVELVPDWEAGVKRLVTVLLAGQPELLTSADTVPRTPTGSPATPSTTSSRQTTVKIHTVKSTSASINNEGSASGPDGTDRRLSVEIGSLDTDDFRITN